MRHRATMLAPPPPSPQIAQSAAYRALTASAQALLVLIEAEVAEQGGPFAAMDCDDIQRATGMRRPAIIAALNELAAAGFIVASESGGFCIVALSSAWRRT